MAGFINKLVKAATATLAGWFETYAWIVDKGGRTIKPTANALQVKVSEVIDWCEANNRPVRLIILKPRQKGCSTVSVGALYRYLKLRKLNATIIGSGYKQSANLFKILKTYSKNDSWDQGGPCTVQKDVAKWGNGAECDRLTAKDPEAGRSGTYQVVLATEVARWAEQGVANAAEVLSGLLKTIGYEDGTLVILESTAAGAYGDYYDRYQNAVTFEEAKAGKPGYIKIFMPWFVFSDSERNPEEEGIYTEEDLTGQEREYMREWQLNLRQMAWFRWALREECNGDFDRFQQDYPSDEVTAFLKSGRARFSAEGMKWQRRLAIERRAIMRYGVLNENFNRIGWDDTTEHEALWKRWEEPRDYRRYLVSVDSMTGASQTGSDDPDSHSVKVLRAGYLDERGRWHKPMVCMSLVLYADGPRKGNWWDIDVLTREVLKASKYYGNCIIIPEVNMDRGMIELLKLENAHIYTREVFNKRTNEFMEAYGWQTTTATRPMIIEELARQIRETPKPDNIGGGIEINDEDTIKQCEAFVRKENGREEAAQGAHDDEVLALAIGVKNLQYATTYMRQVSPDSLPHDLRMLEGDSRRNRRGGTFGV